MEFGVCLTNPATPSFPLPPKPTGQLTAVPRPTRLAQELSILARKSVQQNDVPDPSERCTTTIAFPGSVRFGLDFWISGSFQVVIVPRKIPAMAFWEKLTFSVTPSRL